MMMFLVLSICFLTDCPENGSTPLHVWYNLAGFSFEMYVLQHISWEQIARQPNWAWTAFSKLSVFRHLTCVHTPLFEANGEEMEKRGRSSSRNKLSSADWPNQTPCTHVCLSSVSYGPSRKEAKQNNTTTFKWCIVQYMPLTLPSSLKQTWAGLLVFPTESVFALLFFWTAGHSLGFFCFGLVYFVSLRTTETLWTSFPTQACDPCVRLLGISEKWPGSRGRDFS